MTSTRRPVDLSVHSGGIRLLAGLGLRSLRPYFAMLVLGAGLSLALTGLNLLPLALIASVLHILFHPHAAASTAAMPLSLDVGAWSAYVAGIASQLAAEWGAIMFVTAVGGVYVVLVLLIKAAEVSTAYLTWRIRCSIGRDLVNEVFHHVCNLSLDFFHRQRTGELVSRVSNDAYALATDFYEFFNTLFTALPLAVLFALLLVGTHAGLAAIMAGVVLLNLLLAKRMSRWTSAAMSALAAAQADSGARLTEVLGAMHVIKAFAAEDHERKAFAQVTRANFKYATWSGSLKRVTGTLQSTIGQISQLVVLIVGVSFVLHGAMTPETLLLYLVVMNKLQSPLRSLVDLVERVNSAGVYASRLDKILSERSSVPDGPLSVDGFHESLEFRDLSFAYGSGEKVLHGVSLTIRRGETVALVGPSGSGKSTLVNMALRFFDPAAGHVLLDGRDVREFTSASYRRLFGVVTQEPMLFNDTVRNNISYAAPTEHVTDEAVERAARIARVHDFVSEWPEGYDTMIGDRGVRLSGGQKQRLTLARAILRDPAILLLDEGTSALDSQTEKLIQDAIEDYLKGRTAIIVAHRLSTIRNVDRIVVLEQGRIVEQGSHEQLLRLGGAYARLYHLQMSGSAEAPDAAESGAAQP